MAEGVKIYFHLEQDDDGYPPVAVESVWAQPAALEEAYVVDNVPFFAKDATIGDTVKVRNKNGSLWFECVVSRSTNSLIRVVLFDRSAVKEVSRQLESLGCSIEYTATYNLLAVSIPSNILLDRIRAYLRDKVNSGHIDYEEAILRQ